MSFVTHSFTAAPNTLSTNSLPNAIAPVDFNGDGIPDLAVTVGYTTPMFIYLGNGDGTFTTITGPSLSFNPGQFVVGDFNGDRIADLALTNGGSSDLSILLGNGDGTFAAPITAATSGNAPVFITSGDFNGDGILDLAVSDGNTFTILLGKGDGTFTTLSGFSPFVDSNFWNDLGGIAAADFTLDGVLDLVVSNGSEVVILLGIFSFGSTSPVNITGASGTAILTISTTASQTGSCLTESRPTQRNPWYTGGVALACLVLFGLPGRRRKLRSTLGMVLLLALLGWGVAACNGGGKGVGCPTDIAAGTTPGTYAITVTGTAGSLVETGTVTLIVQ